MTAPIETPPPDRPIPAEPASLNVVAFVDEAFWYPTDDGRWIAWDRQDVEVSSWAVLVRWARMKDNRDPVVYTLAKDADKEGIAP